MKWFVYVVVFMMIMTGCSSKKEDVAVDNKEKVAVDSIKSDSEPAVKSDGESIAESDADKKPTEQAETAEERPEPNFSFVCETNDEIKVDTYFVSENKEYGVVSCVVDGLTLWEYEMPESESAQVSSVSKPYVHDDIVYVTGGDSLYALDKFDGTVLWNAKGITGVSSMAFDDVNIYVTCYLDTDFYVVTKDGDIIHQEADPNYDNVVDSKVDGNTLYLYYESIMSDGDVVTIEEEVNISAYK